MIIPAYNAERFLERTLDSVLSQTYTNLEVLVVDDGSTDRSVDIVRGYAARDPRVRLISQSHSGASSARNSGIAASKGEFIALIDADDIWHREKMQRQVDCIVEGGPRVGLVYSWSRVIDEADQPISELAAEEHGDVLAALIYTNIVGNGSSPLIRRSCFDSVGVFNDRYDSCEDWELYLRIAERYEFQVVPRYHVGYRRTYTSKSTNYKRMGEKFELLMTQLQERHREIPVLLRHMSESHFCSYLSALSNENGDYAASIAYLMRSVRLDAMRLLSHQFYFALAKLCLRVCAKPVTVLLWERQTSWRGVKRRAKRLIDKHSASVALIDSRVGGGTLFGVYDRIQRRRMASFRQIVMMHNGLP